MKVIESLVEAARAAGRYNPAAETGPACILWTDGERAFEPVAEQLMKAMPEMLALGDFAPEKRRGPAIWLRCAVAGTLEVPGFERENGRVPIVYLPGVSRGQFRNTGRMGSELSPLAYWGVRGCFFTQRNGKDWTREAFLASNDGGGLGLELERNAGSAAALDAAFGKVLRQEVENLRGRRLGRDDWNGLLTGEDFPRDMLSWLSKGDAWRTERDEAEWRAFRELAKAKYGVEPDVDGRDAALAKFAGREEAWGALFARYAESWKSYPGILEGLKALRPPTFGLFDTVEMSGGWPQWNSAQEKELLAALRTLSGQPASSVARTVAGLEEKHGERRGLPWALMGESPGAMTLEWLSRLAIETGKGIGGGGTLAGLGEWYGNDGWKADAAALAALEASGGDPAAEEIAKEVVLALYRPWLTEVARAFQKAARETEYQGETTRTTGAGGTLWLFADGLRLDAAELLGQMLEERGMTVTRQYRWAPVPSVTPAGKPAAVPCRAAELVQEGGEEWTPDPLRAMGKTFAQWLEEHGLVAADNEEYVAGTTARWREFGENLDEEGHTFKAGLAKRLTGTLEALCREVERGFDEGSQKVCVVTDHGWLLLPGGLPKEELPGVLADERHGRWAVLKDGASAAGVELPPAWTEGWGKPVYFARGICSHRAGMEYTHGGLSLQECRLLELEVSRGGGTTGIMEVAWRRLRLNCEITGAIAGCRVDLREGTRDGASLLSNGAVEVQEDGHATGLLADALLEGTDAVLVVLGPDGDVRSQKIVRIGG